MSNIILVSIEGNIGAGKSTLIKQLQECSTTSDINIVYLQEPVNEWNKVRDRDGVTILENFYENPSKYAFPFQMMAYITRLKLIMNAIEENTNYINEMNKSSKTIIVMERSLWTDKNIFAKMLYDDGKIGKMEYDIYNLWFNEFVGKIPPMKVIYLKVPPSICLERIKKRNRNGEENISLEYLKSCHQYHEDWLNQSEYSENEEKCLTIEDNNKRMTKTLKEWIQTLK